jgi:hypothetical protein
MTRWAQVLAISFVGVGALVLTVQNNLVQAMFLYGALASWSLKNGSSIASTTAILASKVSTGVRSVAGNTGAAKQNSTPTWQDTENNLELLRDGEYENSW